MADNSRREPSQVAVERVVVHVPIDPYLSLRALSGYAGTSVRLLRRFLASGLHPLPHYRVGGKILVRRSEFDTWMMKFRVHRAADVDAIVNEIVADLDLA